MLEQLIETTKGLYHLLKNSHTPDNVNVLILRHLGVVNFHSAGMNSMLKRAWRKLWNVCDERNRTTSDESSGSAANQLIVQAERFKAHVEAPKGKNYAFNEMMLPYDYEKIRDKFVKPEGLAPLDNEIMFLRNFDQDHEFFHITSQIDPNLKARIERGEFIDLERLLPKDKSLGRNDDLNKQLYNLITQGTSSFLDAPMPKNAAKINGIRKWDQAFRVYAAIYTHANPERASEIWQYIYVIHTAAASNPWDNVYYYNVNFQELMASKPWRSWGKTYTQGWNMAFNNSNSQYNYYQSQNSAQSTHTGMNEEILQFENFDITNVVSPVNTQVLEELLLLSNYDKQETAFLLNGFRNGFSTGYKGQENVKIKSPNLKFRGVGNPTILWNKVMKEVKAQRYAGPFEEIPFEYFIQSPIGLIPKDGGKDTRLIFHLSYPRSRNISVNANTPKDMRTVAYPDFNDAIQLCIKAGKGCNIAKSDMKSAFRN